MTNGITQDLNELLLFGLNLGQYVGKHSTWKIGRSSTTPQNLLENVPLTLTFQADVVLSDKTVRCEYLIDSRWLLIAPRVKSSAPWLRKNLDWHVFDDGGLCWVYPPHYRKVLAKLSAQLDRNELNQTAAYWCVASSADLIEKHFVADRHALKYWPPEWEAWDHGDEAKDEFEKMTRRGRIDAEVRRLLAARRADRPSMSLL